MARTTHVARAQQRYETVPVIDPETGQPKRTPVMRKDGTPKKTKAGREVFMTVTVQDKTKPLPAYRCDACREPIEIGTPYKHISPKSGPYGGSKLTRHEACPSWQVWEYSSSLSARLAEISHNFSEALDGCESPDDVTSALSDAAGEVSSIAEEKATSAESVEEGFGHPTSASEQLAETAESLEEWAGEIESADVPEMVDCEDCTDGKVECPACEGTGKTTEALDTDCPDCSGDGEVECETCGGTGEDIDTWRDAVRDEVTIVDESPV